MSDIDEALSIIRARRERGFFVGPREVALIERAERALGDAFPPMYRAFVEQFGAGNFGAFEIFGVVNENFEHSTVPNGVWLTLDERKLGYIAPGTMLISDTGDGGYYSIDLGAQDGPVSIVWPGGQSREIVADNFGSFLLEGIKRQL